MTNPGDRAQKPALFESPQRHGTEADCGTQLLDVENELF